MEKRRISETSFAAAISVTSAANGKSIGNDTTIVRGTLSDYTKNNSFIVENNKYIILPTKQL